MGTFFAAWIHQSIIRYVTMCLFTKPFFSILQLRCFQVLGWYAMGSGEFT